MNYSQIEFESLGLKYNTDKVSHHGYHFCYPLFLNEFRNLEFNLLEIGYFYGSSINLWKDFFPKAKVFSADINAITNQPNHIILKCDQSKISDLKNLVQNIKTAKIIIDDGSHNPNHQIDTFYFLFKELLDYGGIYIIEDIETSYWDEECENCGYIKGNYNCIDYTKKLIDLVNSEFSNIENKLKISFITYSQNCIIIKKQSLEEIKFFNRQYRFKEKLIKNK